MKDLMQLWQYLRTKFLFLVWLGMVIAPGMGLSWVKHEYPRFVPSPIMAGLIVGYIMYCVATFYLLVSTIHHLDEDPAVSFFGATKHGIHRLRLLLTFIPIVGAWFELDENPPGDHHDAD